MKDIEHPEVPPELVEGHVEGGGPAKPSSFDWLRMTISILPE
jgi:hypothetical protein